MSWFFRFVVMKAFFVLLLLLSSCYVLERGFVVLDSGVGVFICMFVVVPGS